MFAVVADTLTTPPELIEIASVSEAEPIVPASGITMFPLVVRPPTFKLASVVDRFPVLAAVAVVVANLNTSALSSQKIILHYQI